MTVGHSDMTDDPLGEMTVALADMTDDPLREMTVALADMTDDPLREMTVALADMTDDPLREMTVGLSDMTDDLLGTIFHHLCELGPLSLRHLLFVSRRFYSVTVNNAHLWTKVSLDYAFFHHFHQWPEQGNKFVEHCLLRSGSLPLCLCLDSTDIDARGFTFLLTPLETFGKPELRGFQRCTSLAWGAADLQRITIRMFVELLPKSLPSLKHISFTDFKDPIGGSQFPNCPVLERVEMLYHHEPSPDFWGTNFLHVTALSFGNKNLWVGFDLTTLSLFPVLHDLTLFNVGGTGGLSGINPTLSVIFENLHILRVHGRIPARVLTKLVAPALEELHLKANTHSMTSMRALHTSFSPPCRYIHALLPKAVSAEEPWWATNLSRLVQKCARVKSVYISRWMEEECKKTLSGQDVVLHVQ